MRLRVIRIPDPWLRRHELIRRCHSLHRVGYVDRGCAGAGAPPRVHRQGRPRPRQPICCPNPLPGFSQAPAAAFRRERLRLRAVWAWLCELLRPAASLPATARPRTRMSFVITFGFASTKRDTCDRPHWRPHRSPARETRGHDRGPRDRGLLAWQPSAQPVWALDRDDQQRPLERQPQRFGQVRRPELAANGLNVKALVAVLSGAGSMHRSQSYLPVLRPRSSSGLVTKFQDP
jgi:hypothetical protein